jgi:(p)ppGpp synthase/HD superfamily hydrolase
MSLEQKAIEFATMAHGGQVRKYTGEPYVTHPIAVSKIVKTVTDDEEMIAAAILHDVIEDCDVSREWLIEQFGVVISTLVYQVSDISLPHHGNRAFRKGMDREWLSCACNKAQTIKLADLIHNSQSILVADEAFAKVYMAEKRELLQVLHGGDFTLHARATMMVEKYILSN